MPKLAVLISANRYTANHNHIGLLAKSKISQLLATPPFFPSGILYLGFGNIKILNT